LTWLRPLFWFIYQSSRPFLWLLHICGRDEDIVSQVLIEPPMRHICLFYFIYLFGGWVLLHWISTVRRSKCFYPRQVTKTWTRVGSRILSREMLVYFCILKVFLKKLKFFNIYFVVLMVKIILKKIILF